MKAIPLRGEKAAGRVALVDDEDYALVSAYKWHISTKPRSGGGTYALYAKAALIRDGRRADVYMHKLITGWPLTDHVNGDGLDNRRSNLRPATHSQNLYNAQKRSGASSRFKGVSWRRQYGTWRASIRAQGKSHYLGSFASEEEAAAAYAAAALQLHGEYANPAQGVFA